MGEVNAGIRAEWETAMLDRCADPEAGAEDVRDTLLLRRDVRHWRQRLRFPLTMASPETRRRSGFAVGATFEGGFSNVARSFAGKGGAQCVMSFTTGPASSC
jgi:hypothetical protein